MTVGNGNGVAVPRLRYSLIAILGVLTICGTIIGLYVNLNSSIVVNTNAIDVIKTDIAEQKAYNAELRAKITADEREMREGLRLLAQKLIDMGNK